MRQGVRLGVDVGSVRVGIARTDPNATLAIPLETVLRDHRGQDLRRIVELATERGVIEIVVGLPGHLGGNEGSSALEARKFAAKIKRKLPQIRVCLLDERLSSNQAHGRLAEAGLDSRRRRSVVDQVAAQIILEQALEVERLSGRLPGQEILSSYPDEREISE